jgi:pimeloyl-ACP methyl ester carboxylesterase
MNIVHSKDGTPIAYDIHGSGPALIYITGAACFRKFMPVEQAAKVFAKEFSVYNFDRRGRGASGNTLPWSLEREVEDIEALIDAAGGKAYVYGHSSGAVLALEACMRLGSKVQKAIIHDAAYVYDQKQKFDYSLLSQQVNQFLQAGKNARAMKCFLSGIGMPKPFVFLLPITPGWKTMKALAPTLAYDLSLTSDLPPLQRAQAIAVPIQIIVGEKCPHDMQAVAAALAKAILNTETVRLQGQDHMVKAEVLLPSMIIFLKNTHEQNNH